MKPKRVSLAAAMLVVAMLLAGCASSSPPEGMDASRLEATAKEVLDTMHRRDYEALSRLIDDGALSAEEWQESIEPVLEPLGDFVAYGEVRYTSSKQDGELYVNVLVACEYQNSSTVLRVPLNEEYKPLGIWAAG